MFFELLNAERGTSADLAVSGSPKRHRCVRRSPALSATEISRAARCATAWPGLAWPGLAGRVRSCACIAVGRDDDTRRSTGPKPSLRAYAAQSKAPSNRLQRSLGSKPAGPSASRVCDQSRRSFSHRTRNDSSRRNSRSHSGASNEAHSWNAKDLRRPPPSGSPGGECVGRRRGGWCQARPVPPRPARTRHIPFKPCREKRAAPPRVGSTCPKSLERDSVPSAPLRSRSCLQESVRAPRRAALIAAARAAR